MSSESSNLWQFGEFRIDVRRKVLRHGDLAVAVPLKELEVLSMLVRNRGEMVTKEELIDEIWADSYVEESNLTRHIYLLRKTLKEIGAGDVIENVPRRGYRFTGNARLVEPNEMVLERHTQTRTLIEFQDEVAKDLQSPAPGPRYKLAGALILSAIAFAGIGVWRYAVRPAETAAPEIRSVAVLPFKSFSDVDSELRLRITDALITKLGSLKNVSVRPTNSIVSFARPETDAIEAGQKLEVDAVVDGRIQSEGDRVRVTMQLVSTRNGEQLWSGQFDGKVDRILELQDAIAAALLPKLSRERFMASNATTNSEAYENYLKGRHLWNKRQNSELKKAATYFEHAIALDPNFALAYAGLADTYSQLANDGPTAGAELYAKGKAMANKALEIDPGLSEGYSALGWIAYIHDWNWTEAERTLARAIELNPNNADAHHWRGLNFRALGKTDQYFVEMETARQLAPLTKAIGRNYYDVVKKRDGCARALDYVETLVALHEMSEDERRQMLGLHHTGCGTYEDAISILEMTSTESPGIKTRAFLGVAYAKAGNRVKAGQILADMDKSNAVIKFYLRPYIHVALGDFDSAFTDLEKGIATRDNRFARLSSDDFLEPLRSDPRFKQLLENLNLAQ